MSRFSPGAMTAGIFAILLGLGGAYTVRQHLSQQEEPVETAAVTVPVAAYDLPPGKSIDIKDILLMSMSSDQAEKIGGGMAFLNDPVTIENRIVKNPIKAGQPFRSPDFFPEGMGPGIADQLEPGEVAVTIPVYGVGLVAGFVRAGGVVDVLYRSSGEYETTMRLLERAKVLAVGDSFLENARAAYAADGRYRDPAIMCTLAVSPYQAQVLKAAENRGELTMTLHNPKDAAVSSFLGDPLTNAQDSRVNLDQLLGLPVGERRKTLELYNGGRRTRLTYDRRPVYNHDAYITTPVAANPRSSRNHVSNRPVYSEYRMESVSTLPIDPLENDRKRAALENAQEGAPRRETSDIPPSDRNQSRAGDAWRTGEPSTAYAPRGGVYRPR